MQREEQRIHAEWPFLDEWPGIDAAAGRADGSTIFFRGNEYCWLGADGTHAMGTSFALGVVLTETVDSHEGHHSD